MEPSPPSETASPVGSASATLTAFLAPDIDRVAFIAAWLESRKVPCREIALAGKRHLIVRFGGEAYDPNFRTKILVAHHDRAEGTPGANDNSAACFQLMQLAERLAGSGNPAESGARWGGALRKAHNTVILFTDGEEAAGTGGIRAQGAFAIGSGLKALGLDDADIYVFDACGRGNVLVLSAAGMPGRRKAAGGAIAKRMEGLRDRAREIALDSVPGKWVTLLTPYSDNAGFLAAGLASQVITVLPQAEADVLLFAMAGKGSGIAGPEDVAELERLVTANSHEGEGIAASGDGTESKPAALRGLIPETWRLMHGPGDNAASLTPEAFALMRNFLDCLAAAVEPN